MHCTRCHPKLFDSLVVRHASQLIYRPDLEPTLNLDRLCGVISLRDQRSYRRTQYNASTAVFKARTLNWQPVWEPRLTLPIEGLLCDWEKLLGSSRNKKVPQTRVWSLNWFYRRNTLVCSLTITIVTDGSDTTRTIITVVPPHYWLLRTHPGCAHLFHWCYCTNWWSLASKTCSQLDLD